jgi:hypothetical protein
MKKKKTKQNRTAVCAKEVVSSFPDNIKNDVVGVVTVVTSGSMVISIESDFVCCVGAWEGRRKVKSNF